MLKQMLLVFCAPLGCCLILLEQSNATTSLELLSRVHVFLCQILQFYKKEKASPFYARWVRLYPIYVRWAPQTSCEVALLRNMKIILILIPLHQCKKKSLIPLIAGALSCLKSCINILSEL